MNIIDLILDLIYPPRCMVCNSLIRIDHPRWLCIECKDKLEHISGQVCKKCSRPVEKGKSLCANCVGKDFYFYKNSAVYEYGDSIKSIIYKFKYGNSPYMGKGISKLMELRYGVEFFSGVDYLVAVPIHKKRMKERGFNQSIIMANELSKLVGVKCLNNVLIRKKYTEPQSTLSQDERYDNLKDAFEINKNFDIKSKNIMLVDDIFTTGSTIDACAEILIKNGANEVRSITFSIAVKIKK